MGYHKKQINKGILGEFSKIEEEIEELIDAHLQDNSVMELLEFTDLMGAIEAYTLKKYRLPLENLIKMTRATQSAFIDGERK